MSKMIHRSKSKLSNYALGFLALSLASFAFSTQLQASPEKEIRERVGDENTLTFMVGDSTHGGGELYINGTEGKDSC